MNSTEFDDVFANQIGEVLVLPTFPGTVCSLDPTEQIGRSNVSATKELLPGKDGTNGRRRRLKLWRTMRGLHWRLEGGLTYLMFCDPI